MQKYVLASWLVVAAFPVVAQTAEPVPTPEHSLTGNVGVVSQYIFRGLSQTNGKPAIQGGFDYAHSSGFYVGTWLSNISWFTDQNAGVKNAPVSLASPGSVGAPYSTGASNAASLEWDFYGGYKNTFAGDWNYDVGLIRYYYPGRYDNLGAYRNPQTTEVYGAIGYKWLTLKYSKAISTNTFGVNDSRGATYIDLTALIPVGETGYNVVAHVGRQDYPGKTNVGYWGASGGDNNSFDYTDYKLGLTKEFQGFNFGLAWTYADTKHTAPDNNTTAYMNAFGKNIGRDRLSASISKSF
jgi:uncharacterized protein (TIGR02001 family)